MKGRTDRIFHIVIDLFAFREVQVRVEDAVTIQPQYNLRYMRTGRTNSYERCNSYNTAKLHGMNRKNKAEKDVFIIDSNCIPGVERVKNDLKVVL
jgi:Ser-tRNA(Ala) deacylase AlaX